jgi:hypothetical protein
MLILLVLPAFVVAIVNGQSPAPVIPITSAPVTLAPAPPPTPCLEVPTTGCAVCGVGECVLFPDEIFYFPGQPDVSCDVLKIAGLNGLIPLDQCPFLPDLI